MNEKFGLYLILTDPVAGYESCAQAAVACGVRYLQLRMKHASRADVLKTALKVRAITLNSATRFILNDDLDAAMQSDADGIHLGQDDITLAEARSTWKRTDKIYGLSTHSIAQAKLAEQEKPDYIGIGPVFATHTKIIADPALGTQLASEIAQCTKITSVAIGGINTRNLKSVLEAGLSNFCVIHAVNASKTPATAIKELQTIWQNHRF